MTGVQTTVNNNALILSRCTWLVHTGMKKETIKQTRACKPTHFDSMSVVAALLVTVWVVQQMSHSEEGVIEDTGGNSPVPSINQQHALEQRHKLPPVSLLCLHVTVIRTQHQVHLIDGSS